MQIELNFAEALWTALKAWAKEQAADGKTPTADDCARQVKKISHELIGPVHSVRPEVVEFYASETRDMVERYRVGR